MQPNHYGSQKDFYISTVFSILQVLLSDHPVFQRLEGMEFCSTFQPHSSHQHFFGLIIEDILQMDKALFKQHT